MTWPEFIFFVIYIYFIVSVATNNITANQRILGKYIEEILDKIKKRGE